MSLLDLFSTYVAIYSALFMFFPLAIVKKWHQRKSSEGFAIMTFILILVMTGCWMKYSAMSGDTRSFYSYSFATTMISLYTLVYGIYTDNKRKFVVQIAGLVAFLAAIFAYVDRLPEGEGVAMMGKIAAISQTASIGGPIFQIKAVIEKGTTEYMSFPFSILTFTMIANRVLLGFFKANWTLVFGFLPGLLMNVATISLFYFYPPLTWKVPIIGTGFDHKKNH